ncbi:hypothetical protein [Burkholderia vietnamiensis]|uniref:hypothetical protein n=1 Tax=Burkholderia vietnamiensis TaxID=60552 RepID=UPI0012DB3318|nr:hypothetical protein [Burkholderia vietnamiensis]
MSKERIEKPKTAARKVVAKKAINERFDPAKSLRLALERYWESVGSHKRRPRQERYWIDRWLQQPLRELALEDLTDPKNKHFYKYCRSRRAAGYSKETIRRELTLVANIFPLLQSALAQSGRPNEKDEIRATKLLVNHIRNTSGLSAAEIAMRLKKYYEHDLKSNIPGRIVEGKFTKPLHLCDRLSPSQRWYLVHCSLEEKLLSEKDLACPPDQDPFLWNRVIAMGAEPSDYWKTPESAKSQEWELQEEHEGEKETSDFENARDKAEAGMDFVIQTIRQFANPESPCNFSYHELKSHEIVRGADNFQGMSELLGEIEVAWLRVSNLLQSLYWVKITSGLPVSAFKIQREADSYITATENAVFEKWQGSFDGEINGDSPPPMPDDDAVLAQYKNQAERFRRLNEAMRYQWDLTRSESEKSDIPQLPARDVLDMLWVIWSNRDISLVNELEKRQRGKDYPTPWHHDCLLGLETALETPEEWPKIWAELRAAKEHLRSDPR